ncbi:MAG: FMN-binding protein [Firmicutes bacterium]|nr:FMN-binding protein [Bacillota bacterium]
MLRKGLITLLVAAVLFGAGIGFSLWKGTNEIKQMTVGDVTVADIADGVYQGDTTAGAIKVLLEVTVRDAKIVAINILEHDNGQGEAAESIVEEIIAKQSLQVDTISGATYSSTVILKAVEDALQNG